MSVTLIVFTGVLIFLIGYTYYGKYLAEKVLRLDPKAKTPAQEINDGVDYVPTHPAVLLGHHFASIAGAGPIVGPITAAVFGWVPVALWIVLGSMFAGGVHDFVSLVTSVKHGGKSIGEVIRKNIGDRGQLYFLIFTWFALILVIAAFTILAVQVFVAIPAVATTAVLFMVLAVLFGLAVYKYKAPLGISTVIGVALLFGCVWLGIQMPWKLPATTWTLIMLVYIFIASVAPVWILLQPRDYLNSFLLYASLIGALVGLIVGNPKLEYPAFTSFKVGADTLFPMLFVTVACGAISGFHCLVSSGTTSKQLAKESDARIVGYGAMLIEGVLALVALATVAILTKDGYAKALKDYGGPTGLFAAGVGRFMNYYGVPVAFGTTFGALTLNAFVLTTLDTATRLTRYCWEEFFATRVPALANRWIGTASAVVVGGGLALTGQYTKIWPIFGSSNQLLAALALLAGTVWLARLGRNYKVTLYPMVFMFAVTLTALALITVRNFAAANYILGITGLLLFIMAVFLVLETIRVLRSGAWAAKTQTKTSA
ncbi:MAG: carbon starvation protein A [Bacillota bacterium]